MTQALFAILWVRQVLEEVGFGFKGLVFTKLQCGDQASIHIRSTNIP